MANFQEYKNQGKKGLFDEQFIEWLYRLVREPKRMWRRYLIGNVKFILLVVKEKMMHFL